MKRTISILLSGLLIFGLTGCSKIKITPKGESNEFVEQPEPIITEISPNEEEVVEENNLDKAQLAIEARMDEVITNTSEIVGYFVVPNETTNTIEVSLLYKISTIENMTQENWDKIVYEYNDLFMKMQNTLYEELEVNVKLKLMDEFTNKLLVIDKGSIVLNDFVPKNNEEPKKEVKNNEEPKKETPKKYYCQSCGNEITKDQYNSWKRCSPCARTTHNEQRTEYTCKYCGKGYYIEDGFDNNYCSEICAVNHEGEMHEAYEKAHACIMGCGDTCVGNDNDEDGICNACDNE